MLRFSLASLLVLVLFAAVGSAALANATEIWRQTMVTGSVAVLLVATVAASVRRGRSRAFSLGFALCGWIYLLLVSVPALGLRDDLLTDKALAVLFSTVNGEAAHQDEVWRVAFSPQGNTLVTASTGTVRLWDASTGQPMSRSGRIAPISDFADIGHALWAVIVGGIGGVMAALLCNTSCNANDMSPSKDGM